MKDFRSRALPLLALGVFVCSMESGCGIEGTVPGELGNGAFTYDCAGTTDAWCETPFRYGGTPRPAVGAPFAIHYKDDGHGAPQVVAAAPARLATSRGRFAFLAPGTVALLARGSDGRIHDFFHITAEPAFDLELVRADGARLRGTAPAQELAADPWAIESVDALVLAAGQRPTIFGFLVGADGEVLAGSAPWDFSVEPQGIVALHGIPEDNVVEVEALAEGNATIRVHAAGSIRDIPVVVEVGP